MATILDLDVIPTHNPKTLGIADISIYEANQAINAPTLEVTPPGFGKVAISFNPHNINILNSNNLKLTATLDAAGLVNLPDGIWLIKYSIQPSLTKFVNKKFFRVDALLGKYYQIYLTVDLSDCSAEGSYCLPNSNNKKNQEVTLREIELMINGAIAAANRGEDQLAMDMYKRADLMIDRFNICQSC